MNPFWRKLATALALLLLACAPSLSQEPNSAAGGELHDVFVFLVTPEGLLGPDALAPEVEAWDAIFDPFGIQRSVDDWRTKTGRNDAQILHDGLWQALGPFHFESTTMNILAAVEAGSDWVIWDTTVVDVINVIGTEAKQVYAQQEIDYLLGVDARYFVSPGLDRVRVAFRLKLARGTGRVGRPRILFTRQYEYLSPSVGQPLRPWHEGEKEAHAAEIDENFRRLVEEHPENAEIYEKEEARALKRLARREVIPPDLAIAEAWPEGSLARELARARRHMQHMMALDLHVLTGPEPERGQREVFELLDDHGDAAKETGYLVGTLDDNTIYRDRKRNYFSVPKDQ